MKPSELNHKEMGGIGPQRLVSESMGFQ